jgi:dihydroorotate dehydrogenase (NAD+) catalytic subunit
VKRNANCPIVVKLSPNVDNIGAIAREVASAGADAICAVNSLGPGLVLDIETARPVLSNKTGGVSGAAIRPIAVRCVRDVCQALKNARLPTQVIGTGGVTTARDAIEMILVGATCVGIGSAVYGGLDVFAQVTNGIADYMARHDYRRVDDFRGKALA